jgi:chromosome partitioning protein
MVIYAITNQKGGVGKTTTTVNLGAALAEAGKRVLLIDLDPQGSLSAAVGRTPGDVAIGDVLLDPAAILNAIYPCAGGMHVVTATARLANVLLQLDERPNPAFQLSKALSQVESCYDYTLIDCPPALSHATTNALTAAQVALVPLQCEFLSLRGMADVQEITATVKDAINPNLRLRVVGTMFDKRTLHAQDVLREAKSALPGLVYDAVIPRTIRLAEAPAVGQTILEYAPESNGSYAYRALAQEILKEDSGYATSGGYPSRDAGATLARSAA